MAPSIGAMRNNKGSQVPDDDFFAEPADSVRALARAEAAEALQRVLLWMSDGKDLAECGFRTVVGLSTIRSDLYSGATLEALGLKTGRKRQAVWKLREEFKAALGL